jgi:hypothetical protein
MDAKSIHVLVVAIIGGFNQPLDIYQTKTGGHVEGKHAPNTIASNDILLLAFLESGGASLN